MIVSITRSVIHFKSAYQIIKAVVNPFLLMKTGFPCVPNSTLLSLQRSCFNYRESCYHYRDPVFITCLFYPVWDCSVFPKIFPICTTGGPPLKRKLLTRFPLPRFLAYVRVSGGISVTRGPQYSRVQLTQILCNTVFSKSLCTYHLILFLIFQNT